MRRSHFTFVKAERESRKSYCSKCIDIRGVQNKLVVRVLEDGTTDDKFKVCSYCGDIVPTYDVMLHTEYEPKATIVDNPFESASKVVTPLHNRQVRNLVTHIKGYDNDVEITDFAGKPDEILENAINEGAIILSVSDSNDDDEE